MSGEKIEMTPSNHSNDDANDQLRPHWQLQRAV